MSGVTLINTDDVTVTEDDVTYIDGVPSDASRSVQTLDKNGNASSAYIMTLIDTSTASVTVTLPNPANVLY